MTKGEETRRRIIERSAPVFNKIGFGTTSMSDLMLATGLEKGGLYRHFESKEELACEAFDYACEVLEEDRRKIVSTETTGLAKFEKFVEAFGRQKSYRRGCPIFNSAVEHDDGNPALRKKARAAYNRWLTHLVSLLDEAKASRQLKKSADTKALAQFSFCSIEGALIAFRLTGHREILDQQVKMILEYVRSHAPETRT